MMILWWVWTLGCLALLFGTALRLLGMAVGTSPCVGNGTASVVFTSQYTGCRRSFCSIC